MTPRTAADVPTRRVTPKAPMAPYGMELVLDLHDCDHTLFTREHLTTYFEELCDLLGMVREKVHFWDYEDHEHYKKTAPAHLNGTSAVQFIRTSNVTIHTLDDMNRVYLNIFSCKEFNVAQAVEMTTEFFGAGWCGHHVFERS